MAFNHAPRNSVTFYTKFDDYTAGEMYHIKSFPKSRFIKGVQWHAIAFLGADWGEPGLRYSESEIANYLAECNKQNGVVTFDICIYRSGNLDISQKLFLKKINSKIKGH